MGGAGSVYGNGIAVDTSGNAYVTGYTDSRTFPVTPGAFQGTTGGNDDAFVTKLNATGTALVYSTYLGGAAEDHGDGIAVDSAGNASVTGETYSTNFPTANAFQPVSGGMTAFVTKLNTAGAGLIYSTYLGGTGGDSGEAIAVDSKGNAYVTGLTNSVNFPTLNPFQSTYSGGSAPDAFVTKLNTNGTLLYSTYLGPTDGNVIGYGIAVDSKGNAYVTGSTRSANFPTTTGAFQTTYGGSAYTGNAFVTLLTPVLVSPATLAPTALNAPYNRVITATGSTAPYSYAVTNGALPPGLTLTPGGVLSGTPTTAGSYTFTVTATDSTGNTGSRQYTLVVAIPNATPAPAPTRAPIGSPNVVPAMHTPAAAVGVGTPTPLPQPARH